MPRVRHHVNPLNAAYLSLGVGPLALPDDGEVEVELGCADARFLFERAAARADLTCVGVELRRDLVADVNERARAAALPNLRAVFANANSDLAALFPDGRLARAFVNFPDPWFKERRRKRRLLSADLLARLRRKLVPGGALFFQSDVWALAIDAMAEIESADGFENVRGPWSFLGENPFGAKSLREVRCEEKGLRIWRILYRAA